MRTLTLLTALCTAAWAQVPPQPPTPARLTLEDLFHPEQKGTFVPPAPAQWSWLPDGGILETKVDREKGGVTLARLDPVTFEARPLLDLEASVKALTGAGAAETEARKALGQGKITWNPARTGFVLSVAEDLFLVDVAEGRGLRLTRAAGPEDEATFSPDGRKVAFLRGNDLYVVDAATAQETRLTTGGGGDHFHGRLDWVYQEEIYGRGNFKGFWWAPDSQKLAYLDLDETHVPTYTLVDDRAQPQRLLTARYPKAGDPNPVARLGIVDLQGRATWPKDTFEGQETLIVRVGWDPQGRLLACITDRVQSWLELRRFEGPTSKALVREDTQPWQDPEKRPFPLFLKDGSFLWESDRSGHRHLYRFDGDGRLKATLTAGSWEIRSVHGVDEKAGKVYFDATERSPIGQDLYVLPLAPAQPNEGLQRLSWARGTHRVAFNPSFTAYLDTFSDALTPPRTAVVGSDAKVRKVLHAGEAPKLKTLQLGQVRFQQVRTRDGFAMETMLVLPPGFDPAKKHPVFHHVYGGPQAPQVANAFGRSTLWYHFLAQQGYVVWICDNRSASAKGMASAAGIHRKLGHQELQDQLDGLAWLRKQGWADMDRIALEGWSYGGYLTAYALTHSDAWKVGIVGAPVADWRLYDSVYTERYMGTPQDNAAGYDASSVLKAAGALKGKLLLLHGTLDDNVHPQNSIQFLDALQKAGHSPDGLVLLPGSDHSPRAPQHVWTQYKAVWDFLQKNL